MKRFAFLFLLTTGLFAQSKPSETPKSVWIPDPSAGHYDCPEGWTAFGKVEPEKPYYGPIAAIYHEPPKDKKGHILGVQPPQTVCIQDSK